MSETVTELTSDELDALDNARVAAIIEAATPEVRGMLSELMAIYNVEQADLNAEDAATIVGAIESGDDEQVVVVLMKKAAIMSARAWVREQPLADLDGIPLPPAMKESCKSCPFRKDNDESFGAVMDALWTTLQRPSNQHFRDHAKAAKDRFFCHLTVWNFDAVPVKRKPVSSTRMCAGHVARKAACQEGMET